MYNSKFFLTVLAFLAMVQTNLSAQLQADLKNNRSTLDDQVLELKKEITGGGTIDLIDGTTDRVDGICSFDKNKLNPGRAFVFEDISIGYANNAAAGLEGALAYNTVAPKELQNALFIINQDGREVLRMPLRDLANIYTATKESDEYCKLQSLRFLADDRTITMQIKFPPGVALAAGSHHYVYVRIKGLQTTKKANA